MQYLLTESEYEKLVTLANRGKQLPADKELQKLCTDIANTMPVDWKWGDEKEAPLKPWGCIITKPGEWYCDRCPVQEICPHENKEWSK